MTEHLIIKKIREREERFQSMDDMPEIKGLKGKISRSHAFFIGSVHYSKLIKITEEKFIEKYSSDFYELDLIFLFSNNPNKIYRFKSKLDPKPLVCKFGKDFLVLAPFEYPNGTEKPKERPYDLLFESAFGQLIEQLELPECGVFNF